MNILEKYSPCIQNLCIQDAKKDCLIYTNPYSPLCFPYTILFLPMQEKTP